MLTRYNGTPVADDIDGTPDPDVINGTDDPDVIRGFAGNDILNGLGGDDDIDGGEGNDTIDGGTGADVMAGGAGDDIYYVDDAGDVVTDSVFGGNDGGFDRIYTTISYRLGHLAGEYVERLYVFDMRSTYFVSLTANALNNEMWGNDGVNWLDGGTGADIMHGEKGDDIFFVDNAGDIAVEALGEGYDTVMLQNGTLSGYRLSSNVERLIATDSATVVDLAGNSMANEIVGNSGNNRLGGATLLRPGVAAEDGMVDILKGGDGDDVYLVGNGSFLVSAALDVVIEYANGGHDRVETTFSYTLTDNVEDLTGRGTLTGNDLDNTIIGSESRDILDGRGGADVLRGLASNDVYIIDNVGDVIEETLEGGSDLVFIADIDHVLPADFERAGALNIASTQGFDLTGNELANELWGNDGANWLDGKLGRDILYGYGGADTFAFTTLVDGPNFDRWIGFEVGVDKMALDDAVFAGLVAGSLPASAFTIGRFASDADDRILYERETGNLFFDRDGTGPLEAQLFVQIHDRLNLTASDFIVI